MDKFFVFLIFSVILFTGCDKNRVVKQAANDFCQCLYPLADMNQQLETLNKENNTDSIAVLIPVARTLLEEADACMKSKEEQYGDAARNIAFKKGAIDILENNCPIVYQYVPKYYQ